MYVYIYINIHKLDNINLIKFSIKYRHGHKNAKLLKVIFYIFPNTKYFEISEKIIQSNNSEIFSLLYMLGFLTPDVYAQACKRNTWAITE